MAAYLKVIESGTYSEKQYFVLFTALFKEYTGSKCLYIYLVIFDSTMYATW